MNTENMTAEQKLNYEIAFENFRQHAKTRAVDIASGMGYADEDSFIHGAEKIYQWLIKE